MTEVELETRLAYQDESLRQLGAELARQQQDIASLLRQMKALQGQLTALRDQPQYGGGSDEPPPPHY